MTYETGSFHWYMHDSAHPWINQLAKCFSIADPDNVKIISKEFSHMACANAIPCWDRRPYPEMPGELDFSEYDGDMDKEKSMSFIKNKPTNCVGGSFMWYCQHSGSFVTNMSLLILMSSQAALEIIDCMYPQMVAAFKRDGWGKPPEGFVEDKYNSPRK